jgi:hypothetical protein
VVRCSQLNVISKANYGRLFGQIKSLGWNSQGSSEPGILDVEVPQRMERMCLRAVAEGAISMPRAAELMRLSIKELNAKFMGTGV